MISLTDTARTKIQRLLNQRGGVGIRLAVKTTGCSGLAYVLEFVDDTGPGDVAYPFEGFSVIVNEKHKPYLQGMQIDYTKKGLNEGFDFVVLNGDRLALFMPPQVAKGPKYL